MKPQHQFYEIVRVRPNCRYPQLAGLEGVILGMSQEDSGTWGYAVMLRPSGVCWDLYEADLESTGNVESRDSIYEGTTVHVIVDPTTGEGSVHSLTTSKDTPRH